MHLHCSTPGIHPVFLLAVVVTAACAGIETSELIEQDALAERLRSNDAPLVLDVRTPGEYRSGHVPNAVNIPHTRIAARAAELGAKDREIVVYCEVGPRARYAYATLKQAGFSDVRHLAGDMALWRQSGLPVQRP